MSKPKAFDYYVEAQQKIKKLDSFFTRLFINRESIQEEIIELLEKAFEQFQIIKEYKEASNCIELILRYSTDSSRDSYAQDAIKFYVKTKNFARVEELIELYFPPERINGSTIKVLSNLCDDLIKLYDNEKAEKYLIMGEEYSEYLDSSDKMEFKKRRAMLLATLDTPKYSEAAELFVKIAQDYSSKLLLSLQAIDMYLKSIIVYIAMNDIVKAQETYTIACNSDHRFESSIDGKLCKNIIESIINYNLDSFQDSILRYDNVKKFEPFITSLLLIIKRRLQDDNAPISLI
jgi:alpha-soluble NSF attachment protein